jgi:hypothetical protein
MSHARAKMRSREFLQFRDWLTSCEWFETGKQENKIGPAATSETASHAPTITELYSAGQALSPALHPAGQHSPQPQTSLQISG